MQERDKLVAVRDYLPADRNFILATWLRGLRYGSEYFGYIDKDAYFEHYHKFIESLLARPDTYVKVACLKDDPEVILAYSVLSYNGTRSLHWIFCKKVWRGIGIAKLLIPGDVQTVTHLTTTARSVLQKHPTVKFNPFL